MTVPPKRIAVIAVHGVGYHRPGETVRAIADLVLRGDLLDGVDYSSFDESDLRIATDPTVVPEVDIGDKPAVTNANRFDERLGFVRALQAAPEKTERVVMDSAADVQPEDVDALGFMRSQLRDFRPAENDRVYETTRLRTVRSSGGIAAEAHFYEMYWADLSRLSGGVMRILGEVYQLLFHLSSLGRNTAALIPAEHRDERSYGFWMVFFRTVTLSARVLTLPIPILNLFILLVILLPLPGKLFDGHCETAAMLVAVLVGGIADAWATFQLPQTHWGVRFLAPLLAAAALGIGIWLAVTPNESRVAFIGAHSMLSLESMALLAVSLAVVLRAYAKRRPGMRSGGLLLGLPFGLVLIDRHVRRTTHRKRCSASRLKMIEFIFMTLFISWGLLILGTWILHSAGYCVRHISPWQS